MIHAVSLDNTFAAEGARGVDSWSVAMRAMLSSSTLTASIARSRFCNSASTSSWVFLDGRCLDDFFLFLVVGPFKITWVEVCVSLASSYKSLGGWGSFFGRCPLLRRGLFFRRTLWLRCGIAFYCFFARWHCRRL